MFQDWDSFTGLGKCTIDMPNGDKVATMSCIPAVFANLLSALLMFAGLAALAMFIVGSYKFMNSAGDAKKVESAENNFKFGLIGLAIVVFSFLIIQLISLMTGVTCLTKFGFGCN